MFECPSVLEIKVCPTCDAFFIEGKWVFDELEKVVFSVVKNELKIHEEARNTDISLLPEFLDDKINVLVKMESTIRGADITGEREVMLRLKKESCMRCSRISAGYYESIIQIRAKDRHPTQKEINQCEKIIFDLIDKIGKRDPLAFVSKIEILREGYDIYVGSKSTAKQISKSIVRVLGGDIIESPKLVGRHGGKNIYRITFSVRLPKYLRGDILQLGDKIILVDHKGKKISGLDLKTGLNQFYNEKSLDRATFLCNKNEAKKTVICMEGRREVQILDPDTYKPIDIPKPSFFDMTDGKDIYVIKTSNGIFLVPRTSKDHKIE